MRNVYAISQPWWVHTDVLQSPCSKVSLFTSPYVFQSRRSPTLHSLVPILSSPSLPQTPVFPIMVPQSLCFSVSSPYMSQSHHFVPRSVLHQYLCFPKMPMQSQCSSFPMLPSPDDLRKCFRSICFPKALPLSDVPKSLHWHAQSSPNPIFSSILFHSLCSSEICRSPCVFLSHIRVKQCIRVPKFPKDISRSKWPQSHTPIHFPNMFPSPPGPYVLQEVSHS